MLANCHPIIWITLNNDKKIWNFEQNKLQILTLIFGEKNYTMIISKKKIPKWLDKKEIGIWREGRSLLFLRNYFHNDTDDEKELGFLLRRQFFYEKSNTWTTRPTRRGICLITKINSTRKGFEPSHGDRIGLAVQRLNHSATSSSWRWSSVQCQSTTL